MAVNISAIARTTTPSAAKQVETNKSEGDTPDEHGQSPITIAQGTQQVNAQTTVTTMVLASGHSSLPNLTLEDVLERSGVEQNSQIIIETTNTENPAASGTEVEAESYEAMRNAIESIENSEVVVVEVETTNNVQTVTVRAADIEAAYTHATAGTQASSNFLLLRNGWAYTALESSPLDLPIEPPNQEAGNGWAPWRALENGVHQILDIASGSWHQLVGQLVDTSPKPLSSLAGVFSNSSTEAQLLSTVTTSDTLQLSADGVFTSTRSVLGSGGLLSLETSFVSDTVHSAKGHSTQFSSTTPANDSTPTDGISDNTLLHEIAGDMFGAYRMLEDGMTLELNYADGTFERRLFLQTVSGSLSIGGANYDRSGDASENLLENLLALLTLDGTLDKRGEWLKAMANAIRKSDESDSTKPGNTGGVERTEQDK